MKFLVRTFFVCLIVSTVWAQEFRTGDEVHLLGEIQKDVDFFGHQKYSGTVQNSATWRVDFVKIEFMLFNKAKRLLLHKEVFIRGSKAEFPNNLTSLSSLKPNEKGDFVCLTPIPVDSIANFKYTIYWMEYDTLPSIPSEEEK